MKFTHDELLNAVRIAGENGEPFTCADVRDCLGVKSPDRETLNLFHRRFRTFQKEAAEEIERVGKNAYRLKQGKRARARREAAAAAAAAAAASAPAPVIEAVIHAEALQTAADPVIAAPEALPQPEPQVVAAAPEPEPDATASALESQAELAPLAAAPPAKQEAPLAIEPYVDPVFASTPLEALDVPLQLIEAAFDDADIPEEPQQPETVDSLAREAPVTRGGWRDFGRRVAEFFGRA